ncbi:phosphopantetheine-binding protein [Caulobacter sp. S45]|uniref:phosphopantetheine-binding protein n=1 Tax=Caulobacter sp. S45 TaxID=1641861 RepID=UPI001C2DE885|nr:phosphopantetheine-binding protein [Caulobacter sp. S45]
MSAQAMVKQDGGQDSVRRVLALVDAMLARKQRPAAAPDGDLREAGLSSLDTVNLMLAVEGEFDLFLPQDEMTPENFRSAEAIARLVERVA